LIKYLHLQAVQRIQAYFLTVTKGIYKLFFQMKEIFAIVFALHSLIVFSVVSFIDGKCMDSNDVNCHTNFHIYPNPLEDQAVLKFAVSLEDAKLEMYDKKGSVVFEKTDLSSNILALKRSELAKGEYSYKVLKQAEILVDGKIRVGL